MITVPSAHAQATSQGVTFIEGEVNDAVMGNPSGASPSCTPIKSVIVKSANNSCEIALFFWCKVAIFIHRFCVYCVCFLLFTSQWRKFQLPCL